MMLEDIPGMKRFLRAVINDASRIGEYRQYLQNIASADVLYLQTFYLNIFWEKFEAYPTSQIPSGYIYDALYAILNYDHEHYKNNKSTTELYPTDYAMSRYKMTSTLNTRLILQLKERRDFVEQADLGFLLSLLILRDSAATHQDLVLARSLYMAYQDKYPNAKLHMMERLMHYVPLVLLQDIVMHGMNHQPVTLKFDKETNTPSVQGVEAGMQTTPDVSDNGTDMPKVELRTVGSYTTSRLMTKPAASIHTDTADLGKHIEMEKAKQKAMLEQKKAADLAQKLAREQALQTARLAQSKADKLRDQKEKARLAEIKKQEQAAQKLREEKIEAERKEREAQQKAQKEKQLQIKQAKEAKEAEVAKQAELKKQAELEKSAKKIEPPSLNDAQKKQAFEWFTNILRHINMIYPARMMTFYNQVALIYYGNVSRPAECNKQMHAMLSGLKNEELNDLDDGLKKIWTKIQNLDEASKKRLLLGGEYLIPNAIAALIAFQYQQTQKLDPLTAAIVALPNSLIGRVDIEAAYPHLDTFLMTEIAALRPDGSCCYAFTQNAMWFVIACNMGIIPASPVSDRIRNNSGRFIPLIDGYHGHLYESFKKHQKPGAALSKSTAVGTLVTPLKESVTIQGSSNSNPIVTSILKGATFSNNQ